MGPGRAENRATGLSGQFWGPLGPVRALEPARIPGPARGSPGPVPAAPDPVYQVVTPGPLTLPEISQTMTGMANPKKKKSAAPKLRTVDLESLVDDANNANKGTERGHAMLEKSVAQFGAARSMVVDSNDRLVAGNKTREALVNAGFRSAVIVETDGSTPVIVKRTDFDLANPAGDARQYAYFDNRVAETDLAWDDDQLQADLDDGVDLSALWSEDELSRMLTIDNTPPEDFDEFGDDIETQHKCPKCSYEWSGKSS